MTETHFGTHATISFTSLFVFFFFLYGFQSVFGMCCRLLLSVYLRGVSWDVPVVLRVCVVAS